MLPVDALVCVAQFGEPIYPYLQPLGTVCNAPDSDLWHTLIEADNYHALQLLEYLYAGKVDCIYIDPCCGSGGMFVQSIKFVEAHSGNKKKVSIYGQEYTNTTFKLAKMNLAIRGISANLGEMAANTFTNDQHKDLKADYIMANEAVICGLTPEKARNIKEFAA